MNILAVWIFNDRMNDTPGLKFGWLIYFTSSPKIKHGIIIIAQDEAPGIAHVARALQDGYTTGKGLGLGLSESKRLMDEFDICSEVGKGTTITMKKWMKPN